VALGDGEAAPCSPGSVAVALGDTAGPVTSCPEVAVMVGTAEGCDAPTDVAP
jgi:hypothetical protein